MRTEYCHELAVRLLVGCLAMVAAKYEVGVEVLFSHSIDHYVRAYISIKHGARRADKSVGQMGFILHCFSCFHREISLGIISTLRRVCPDCGVKLSVAGPLWLGKIADKIFSSLLEKEAEKRNLRQKKKLLKIISLVKDEAEASITYYLVDKICDKLNLPIPALKKLMNRVKKEGFKVVPTQFNSRGFRTDAPVKLVKEVIVDLATQKC